MQQEKILKKYLVRNSFKLFFIYMLSSIMITSLNNNSTWESILIKSLSVGFFSFLIFFMNVQIISYFKKAKSCSKHLNHTEKRIFCCGYLFTLLFFTIYFSIIIYLSRNGMELYLPDNIKNASRLQIFAFVFYISLIQYGFIYLIQNFTLNQYEKSKIELELLQLKSSNAETVNKLLKQQIQPHFLFNALNTLKSLIKKNPDTAEDYLIMLSDFLRASFTNQVNGLSSVSDELAICSNYMEMQKIRFGSTIHYNVNIPKDDKDLQKQIPTFSLQPLLENAIKHNIATIENPLYITITKNEDYIIVSNNLQLKKSIENSTGNGLTNLKERYKILSGDNVLIESDNDVFTVSIKILNSVKSNG